MTLVHRSTAARLGCLILATGLSACSSVENLLGGDRIDYRTAGATRDRGLEVPPDLTQLTRDTRYKPSGGSVSAAQVQPAVATGTTVATPDTVAPKAVGDLRMERHGNQRWLVVPMPAEQLWPRLQAFWKEHGFTLIVDEPEAGVMETQWAENRAKLPQDFIRSTIGRAFDALYSTGERDKFRTRVERAADGTSEVYLTHRGLEEVYSGAQKETTVWQPRTDPQLEAEMLQRIMIKLGAPPEQAQTATGGPAPAARARLVEGQDAATLEVDDGFERAWRRVGLALDRSGFTVEDRDRAQGLYFVRYVDPTQADSGEPGLLGRIFSFGRKKDEAAALTRYRVLVKGEGERSTVMVLNAQGEPENGEAGKRIVRLLVDDLR